MTQQSARVVEQRKHLPDGPGVYLFHDERGKVIYVGKAKSIRKRVAVALLQPGHPRRGREMTDSIDSVDSLLVASESEALLAEQNFIKQYQPRFNIRLRDDKSYPFIAISMDEEFPRVYFTRERHRRNRAVLRALLQRQARARHARPARQGLPVPLLPGHRAGPPLGLAVPGLLHQALRRALRRLRLARGVPRGDRRRRRLPVRAATARSSATSSSGCAAAAEARSTRTAALERNRLQRRSLAAGAPARRQRGDRHARRGRGRGRGHRRQRAGLPGARRRALRPPVLLPAPTRASASCEAVVEEFLLQYYAEAMAIPPQIVVQTPVDPYAGRGAGASAAAGGSSCAPPSAATSAASSTWPSATRSSRSTRRSSRASAAASSASRRSTGCRRRWASTRCRCASSASTSRNLMGTHQVASMVVFEGGAPKKSDYRRFQLPRQRGGRARRLRRDGGGARPPPRAVGAPARPVARTTRSSTRPSPRCPT